MLDIEVTKKQSCSELFSRDGFRLTQHSALWHAKIYTTKEKTRPPESSFENKNIALLAEFYKDAFLAALTVFEKGKHFI